MTVELPGRSWLRGEVERGELLACAGDFEASRWLAPAGAEDFDDDVLLVEGDLEVDGPLDMFKQKLRGLVVTGRLIVRGCYEDTDDVECCTFVLGDMQAGGVITAGFLNVGGSLLVDGGLVGSGEAMATVRGRTRARFLYAGDQWFSFGGAVDIEVVLGRVSGEGPARSLRELAASRYPEVLVPEVFHLDEYAGGEIGQPFDPSVLDAEELEDLDDLLMLNYREIWRRVRLGEPVFR